MVLLNPHPRYEIAVLKRQLNVDICVRAGGFARNFALSSISGNLEKLEKRFGADFEVSPGSSCIFATDLATAEPISNRSR